MKASLQLLLASLAAGSVLPRNEHTSHESAIADDDFVYVEGTRLYNKDGLYYLTGILTLFRSILTKIDILIWIQE
jgi:mannan endo-1,4-beta-mannosidase